MVAPAHPEGGLRRLLTVAAAGEAATGLLLSAFPVVVVDLLFAEKIAGAGVVTSRIAGIALLALGVACWPAPGPAPTRSRAHAGMLCYSAFATVLLSGVALAGVLVGPLLWPALVVHLGMTTLLVRWWLIQ